MSESTSSVSTNSGDPPIPPGTPLGIKPTWEPRTPTFDATLGVPGSLKPGSEPPHRLVAIGDSLTHGFQSGAVYNTDLSYPAIIAYELGLVRPVPLPALRRARRPPAQHRVPAARPRASGSAPTITWWEVPLRTVPRPAVHGRGRGLLGARPRSACRRRSADHTTTSRCTAGTCATPSSRTYDSRAGRHRHAARTTCSNQIVENNSERAALRVYPVRPITTSDDAASTRPRARRGPRRGARTAGSRRWWSSSARTTRCGR